MLGIECRPSGAEKDFFVDVFRGLTPTATNCRPFGANLILLSAFLGLKPQAVCRRRFAAKNTFLFTFFRGLTPTAITCRRSAAKFRLPRRFAAKS